VVEKKKEEKKMKSKLLAGLVVAGSSLFAAPRVSFGVNVGVPAGGYYAAPAAVAVNAYVPPCPGPGYAWVGGYYVGPAWHPGYWNHVGARVVVGPRVGFYRGYGRRF
jgi:hypothetical protein